MESNCPEKENNIFAILAEIYLSRLSYEYMKAKDWPVDCRKNFDETVRYFSFRGATLRFNEVPKVKLATEWAEEKGLWAPQTLPLCIWKQALASFETNKSLLTNIQNHVAPIILQNYSKTEIATVICDYFCSHLILDKPIRFATEKTPSLECALDGGFVPGKRVYYFDNSRILRGTNDIQKFRDKKIYTPPFHTTVAPVLKKKWDLATHFFKAGMSLLECVQIFMEISEQDGREVRPPKWSDFEQLVQKIEKPLFEREPENQNKNTFDRIRISVHLSKYIYTTHDQLRDAVKAYRKHIDRLVIAKIKQEHEFSKYGIPFTFLALTSLTLKRDFTLEYLFELRGSDCR